MLNILDFKERQIGKYMEGTNKREMIIKRRWTFCMSMKSFEIY